MPPMLCKVFSGQGVRVPLPPANYSLPSLPVRAQDVEGVLAPDFKWLKTCTPHPRDEAITFEAAGHVYYLGSGRADVSVTSLIATYAQATWRDAKSSTIFLFGLREGERR